MIWPFNKNVKKVSVPQPKLPVLTVRIDEENVCSVYAHEVPTEKLPVIKLTRPDQILHFIDSKGNAHSYDLTSIYEEGERFLHFCIRISPTFVIQPDALLTKDGQDPQQKFKGTDGKGIRLEPFCLPECNSNPPSFVGRGLFDRGLHYSGMVTPGNVSLFCICNQCKKSFRLQSFHAGFSNRTYLYCSRELHTLVASSYLEDAPPVLGKADVESIARFERKLPQCRECGGEFRYLNPLRCPHCREPYIDFQRFPEIREQEYYGNYLYGGTPQYWEPEK